jgi:hypothetical protein
MANPTNQPPRTLQGYKQQQSYEQLYTENRPGSMKRVDRPLKEIAAALAILTGEDATRINSGTRTGDVFNRAGKRVSAKFSTHKPDASGVSHAIDIPPDSVPLKDKRARENFISNLARVMGYKNIYTSQHGGTGEHIHVQTGPDNLGKLNPSSSDFKIENVANRRGRKVPTRVERDAGEAESELLRDLAKIHGTTIKNVKPLLAKMIEENNQERNNLLGHAIEDMSDSFKGFMQRVGVLKPNEPQVAAAPPQGAPAEGTVAAATPEEPGVIATGWNKLTSLFDRTPPATEPVRPPANVGAPQTAQAPTRPGTATAAAAASAQQPPRQVAAAEPSTVARAKKSEIKVPPRVSTNERVPQHLRQPHERREAQALQQRERLAARKPPQPAVAGTPEELNAAALQRTADAPPAAATGERLQPQQISGVYQRTGLSAFKFGRTQQFMMGINLDKSTSFGTDENVTKAREFMKSVVGEVGDDKTLATAFAARVQTYQERTSGHLKADGILGTKTAGTADRMVAQAYKRQMAAHTHQPVADAPRPV